MKKKSYYLVLTIFAVLLAFSFLTCEINLGEYIDFSGPVLRITNPVKQLDQERLLVQTVFNLTGTAECQNEITFMEVSLERYDPYLNDIEHLPMRWKFEEGRWNYKESASKPWKLYQESDYIDAVEPAQNIKAPSWEVNGYFVNWNIPISLADVSTGDIFITVNALDKAGNRNAESTAVLKVYYNNNEPMFGIRSPKAPFIRSTKEPFSLQVYDPVTRPIPTRNNINDWITDAQWKIDYIIDTEAGFPFELLLEFTDDYDVYEDRIIYYHQTIPNITDKFGSINISNISGGSMDATNLPGDEYTPMKIVTTLTDVNDKKYKPRFNGYFAYLRDAEKPWTIIGFDYLLKGGRGSGTAYGKNFIRTTNGITWVVTEQDEHGATLNTYTGGVAANEIPSNSNSYGWTISVGDHWNQSDYYEIEVTVTDVNNNSKTISRKFRVESNSTPRIQENSIQPDSNLPLFGDAFGNFTIKATAEISGPHPATTINKAAIAWIRPDSPNAANARLSYSDRTYPAWNSANTTGFVDNTNRVVLWSIPESGIVFKGTNPSTGLDEYELSRDFNVFTDLNIGLGTGKFPVSAMDFIIRVASNSDSSQTPRSSTQTFTTLGDVTTPVVNLTNIHITRDNGTTENLNWPLQESMLSALKKGDSIYFEGTWNDNSRQSWSGLSDAVLRTHFTKAAVVWEGESNFTFTVTDDQFLTNPGSAVGTWRTQPRQFSTSDNTDAFIYLDVSISDLSGNTGRFRESIMIETDNPTLTMITSSTSDGTYGEFSDFGYEYNQQGIKPIFINLVFNKPVQFFDSSNPPSPTSSPYLELNNGGRAYYVDGNGTSTLTFVYFVDGYIGNFEYAQTNTANAGGSTPQGTNLNVINIAPRSYPLANWVSTEGNTIVSIPSDVYNPSSNKSLAQMKHIVIDKTAPVISRFSSTTNDNQVHGRNSKINIIVEFSEPISVTGSDIRLSLSGITAAGGGNAEALFTNVTGPTSLGFTYTVPTAASTHYSTTATTALSINQFIAASGVEIKDQAGNSLTGGTITPVDRKIFSSHPNEANLRVETRPPNPPAIFIGSGTHYQNADIQINNILLPNNSTIEYTLNSTDPTPVWTTLTSPVQGIAGSGFAIISLEINGTYNIAARQYDTANPRNMSVVSNTVNVIMDKGNILERITSASADGIYSANPSPAITIDLVFRKGLTFTGTYNNVTLTLSNGNIARMADATVNTPQTGGRKTWRFNTTNPLSDTENNLLNVTAINFGTNTSFKDAANTEVNNWITLTASNGVQALHEDNNLNRQKSIQILTGNPTRGGIGYNQTTKLLTVSFNRDIYSANNTAKTVIMQTATNFRIPAVLTVQQFNNLFTGRSDLNSITFPGTRPAAYTTNAAWWSFIGNELYKQDTNGASAAYVSDTATKYVLQYKYSTNPAAADSTSNPNAAYPGNMPTGANLITMFREAEALRFDANDKEVVFSGSTVTFDLARLPVLGATYQITLPNGFVQDFLGNYNGGAITGNDVQAGTDNSILTPNGVEPPFIRIDKGNDFETFNNNTAARQAVQPLQANLRIGCRTPGAAISYARQQTTDNVGRLIWRANPGTIPNRLPNLGNQTLNDWTSFNSVKNRPQSGGINPATGANWTGNGLNIWTAMGTMPGLGTYTADSSVQIGTDNYNDGGMIIHIQARSSSGGFNADAYEAAYRSVLVFHNQNGINSNANNIDVGANLTGAQARMWIRGGDSTQGSSAIPGFPLSRDKTESRKARILTPFAGSVFGGNLTAAQTASFNNSNISATYDTNGYYVWFWVTWKINVNAYLDFFASNLPASAGDAYQVPTGLQKDIYQGYIMAKEHFPVIPGRTTVCESRNVFSDYVDGGHGDISFGATTVIPARKD